jgi:segregation and condensation protein A
MLYEEEHPFAIAYRLVEEGKLDPWNVDIAQLANLYIQEIRKMELLDLRVPARALSVAVFLLKKQVEEQIKTIKRKLQTYKREVKKKGKKYPYMYQCLKKP